MGRERSNQPCRLCCGEGTVLVYGEPETCAHCSGTGELPAVPTATFHGPTFRDAKLATVVADLTEERDRWRAFGEASARILRANLSAMESPSGITVREVLALYPGKR